MSDRSPALYSMGFFRIGVAILFIGTLIASISPPILTGFDVVFLGERSPVPPIQSWTLPSMDVAFTFPPPTAQDAIAPWAAEQMANAVYVIAVYVYYAGLLGIVIGGLLVGSTLYKIRRSADSLGH